MDPQELCEAAKHPVVVGDPKCQVGPLPLTIPCLGCLSPSPMILHEAERYSPCLAHPFAHPPCVYTPEGEPAMTNIRKGPGCAWQRGWL